MIIKYGLKFNKRRKIKEKDTADLTLASLDLLHSSKNSCPSSVRVPDSTGLQFQIELWGRFCWRPRGKLRGLSEPRKGKTFVSAETEVYVLIISDIINILKKKLWKVISTDTIMPNYTTHDSRLRRSMNAKLIINKIKFYYSGVIDHTRCIF